MAGNPIKTMDINPSQMQTKSFVRELNVKSFVIPPYVLRSEQPQPVKTELGDVKFVVAVKPLITRIETKGDWPGMWISYDTDWANKSVEYHVLVPESYGTRGKAAYARTGFAIVHYSSIENAIYSDRRLGEYLAGTVPEHARVALLANFFPFGFMDDKHVEYRHKGIGKNLLDLIRRECTEEGASVVHCQVISMEMLGLVNKLGFENVPNTPTFLLRLKRAHEENVA